MDWVRLLIKTLFTPTLVNCKKTSQDSYPDLKIHASMGHLPYVLCFICRLVPISRCPRQ